MPRLLASNCAKENKGIYLIDTHRSSVERVFDESIRGITYGPDGIYGVGNRGAIYHLDPRTWKATLRSDSGWLGCHDLRFYDGYFYLVACTGNRILKMDPELRVVDELQLVKDEEDVCHVNCLTRRGDEMLVSIFTFSPGKREDKNTTHGWRHEGKVLRLDWARKGYDILYEPLSQPHSLVWNDGLLYCCESFTSEVSALSLEKRTKRRVARLSGFVRGLAFVEGHAYVGISHERGKTPNAWQRLVQRFRPVEQFCGVVEMDQKTWKTKRRFEVPGTQVYEVMLLQD